jgi:uncharacterized protein (DUF2164 family)
MTDYTIQITEDYVVPEGYLTAEQYVNFVMNKASESYRNQYGTEDKIAGIQAACDAYNASVVIPEEPVVPEEPTVEE